ncbi:MAG: hypothetical protein ACE5GC_10880, partial [Acidimicrobiia bacterium]
MIMRPLPAIVSALAVLAAACGSVVDEAGRSLTPAAPAEGDRVSVFGTEPPTTTKPTPPPAAVIEPGAVAGQLERPPPVIVGGDGVELALEAWTACWGGGCYDGRAPHPLPDVGSPEEILVEFPVAGWEFSATTRPIGDACGRNQTEPLVRIGATSHRLEPVGLAGEYEVTLFGRGPNGDLFVSFRWVTTVDGVLPVPAAFASIVADHDGRLDSYGVEVPVWNLAATPAAASGA